MQFLQDGARLGLSVRDRVVHHIVKQCPKLEGLTISSCSQVTDVSLVEISTYLPTVRYLDVSGCKKVTDTGIQALVRTCHQLCYLDLSSTGTGKRGVCLLASYCHKTLECLKLSFCKDVTVDAVEKLYRNCKRCPTERAHIFIICIKKKMRIKLKHKTKLSLEFAYKYTKKIL
ncbi:hypothetical protein NDU88_002079 [Pleurodeles waltl]|uniref:F-box/LRR-repeat protein 15-like leucin rich repeat domain-containing protein n=1 Tax=Pleurodeles waltl TaxID=8319 RepID=A0AAV7W287_PLEWA|nr:hypothetical protein NDU88_002079 [Pleurodeles waltl]